MDEPGERDVRGQSVHLAVRGGVTMVVVSSSNAYGRHGGA